MSKLQLLPHIQTSAFRQELLGLDLYFPDFLDGEWERKRGLFSLILEFFWKRAVGRREVTPVHYGFFFPQSVPTSLFFSFILSACPCPVPELSWAAPEGGSGFSFLITS